MKSFISVVFAFSLLLILGNFSTGVVIPALVKEPRSSGNDPDSATQPEDSAALERSVVQIHRVNSGFSPNITNASIEYCISERHSQVVTAATLPVLFEMLTLLLCFYFRDWKMFLEAKWETMGVTLIASSFAFFTVSCFPSNNENDIWMTIPTYVYFTLLVEFEWTFAFSSNVYFNHIQSNKIVTSIAGRFPVWKIWHLAIELCGTKVIIVLVTGFIHELCYRCHLSDLRGTVWFFGKIPIVYFFLVISCIVLMITVAGAAYHMCPKVPDGLSREISETFVRNLLFFFLMASVWTLWIAGAVLQMFKVWEIHFLSMAVGAIVIVATGKTEQRKFSLIGEMFLEN